MKDQVSAKLAKEIYEIRAKSMTNAIEQLGEERVKEILRKLYVDYAMSTPLMSETLKKGRETIRMTFYINLINALKGLIGG